MNIRMPLVSIIIGLLLILQGLGFWMASSTGSATSLIPAWFGAAIGLLGVVASVAEPLRKHVMHAAMLVALLAVIGGGVMAIRGIAQGSPSAEAVAQEADTQSMSHDEAAIALDTRRWTKIWAQGLLGGISLVYLGMGVATFVAARRGGD